MEKRTLQNGATLLLYGKGSNGEFAREFTIQEQLGCGGSAISYIASHSQSDRGVLKEFCPQGFPGLSRAEDGRLRVEKAQWECFAQAQEKYLEPYERLLRIKRERGGELETFLPSVEIYLSAPGDAPRIAYVWTPRPPLVTFEEVCKAIHAQPSTEPEAGLDQVLRAVTALAKCLRLLHEAGLVHGDVKPANFGFPKRGNELLVDAPELFDVDSIRAIGDDAVERRFTPGYTDMRDLSVSADIREDIYSFGAVLFHAVVLTEETRISAGVYDPAWYDRLAELVDSSECILALNDNVRPTLRKRLTTVLRRCLCERSARYADCKELLDDLRAAQEELVCAQRHENPLGSVAREPKVALAMHCHFYRHPLYQGMPKDAPALELLFIGFDRCGQMLLDLCLQNGQLLGKELRATILSPNIADWQRYLRARPALKDFFTIDGQGCAGESYGDIRFRAETIPEETGELRKFIPRGGACCAFAATGDDGQNERVAQMCREAFRLERTAGTVRFVWLGDAAGHRFAEDTLPVLPKEDAKAFKGYEEIERMAFNSHLVWADDLDIDYAESKRDFRRRGNHESCISNVCSIKYKLYSVGIDMSDVSKAAAEFSQRMMEDGGHMVDALACAEHRRWVVEKLCAGWRQRPLEACRDGKTSDAKRKLHICLLRSRPERALHTNFSRFGDQPLWDRADDAELRSLDDLDRLSVDYHRMFAKMADEAIQNGQPRTADINALREAVRAHSEAEAAFREWYACAQAIRNGDRANKRVYDRLHSALRTALERLPEAEQKPAQDHLSAFDAAFLPILNRVEYRDFKRQDVALTENIPFILTYSESVCMVVPYAASDVSGSFSGAASGKVNLSALFSNVAAATVANPMRIVYLYLAQSTEALSALKATLPHMAEYMRKKNFNAKVEFAILHTAAVSVADGFPAALRALSRDRVEAVTVLPVESDFADAPAKLERYLKRKQRSRGVRRLVIEKNGTALSTLMLATGFYRRYPSYRFDSRDVCFKEASGCDELLYIRKTPVITVADMMSIGLTKDLQVGRSEFYLDHEALWKTYNDDPAVWKLLCGVLEADMNSRDALGAFPKNRPPLPSERAHTYIVSPERRQVLGKVIEGLVHYRIAGRDSCVRMRSDGKCELFVQDPYGFDVAYRWMLAQMADIHDADAVEVRMDTRTHQVSVVCTDGLMVEHVLVSGSRQADIFSLMRKLEEMGIVSGLSIDEERETMRFSYASRAAKELLTTAGKMLEVHVYHCLKASGAFDDVVMGLSFHWGETSVKNEIDCMLTKGFSCAFVECKARAAIDADFYYKLRVLCDRFGVNAKPILLIDTREKSYYDVAITNDEKRERGREMGIETVWTQDEIGDPAGAVAKILEGAYRPKHWPKK